MRAILTTIALFVLACGTAFAQPGGFGANDIAGDFDGAGLWRYHGGEWSKLTPSDPEDILACCVGIAGDFGSVGMWFYGPSGWEQLTPSDPAEMVCWSNQIAARFDPGVGLWLYDCAESSWELLTPEYPEEIASTPSALVIDFGAIGMWKYNADGWEQLTPSNPSSIAHGMDGVTPGVAKSGQALCVNSIGALINCAGTGQDGEYRSGVSVLERFTDNGDGTVADNLTGLIWLRAANCFGLRDWTSALSDANGLADGTCGLSDGSVPGDWRLPNVRQLHSLIEFGQFVPALPPGHPFSGVLLESTRYWSSTAADSNNGAWYVFFSGGFTFYINSSTTTATGHVWPVRGPE